MTVIQKYILIDSHCKKGKKDILSSHLNDGYAVHINGFAFFNRL